mmetsp:Transcript_21560/g.59818  ORF Transcript_21560/g.59818 Transcript_21560/m.59818 type:complete len:599 (+) Transcript_21560:57-1853(+)
MFSINHLVLVSLLATESLAWQPLAPPIRSRARSSPHGATRNHESTSITVAASTMALKRRSWLRLGGVASASEEREAADSLPQVSMFNSLTKQKDVLVPVKPGKISMYTCGPTVYDFAHVGNFRAFLTYDLVKRVLEYYGYDVTHICNLTDVDDKIIQRATEQELDDVTKLTLKFENLFMEDLKALNIRPAKAYPRATDYIPEMMEIILLLRDEGLAYETSDGSWYFRTQAQPGYGSKLVKLNYDEMESTERAEATEEKEHFADFALWKGFKEGIDREDMSWESEDFKKGRPGWHLECSAMIRKFFGSETIDLHGGGVDLKFPHHENEIAQSEGAMMATAKAHGNHDGPCSCVFCNCWFHNGFVNIGDEKMSKSLGNFLTLRGACPTGDDVRAYRYLVISSQYRSALAFTHEAMNASKNAIKRIDKVRAQMEEALAAAGSGTDDGVNGGESNIADSIVPGALQNFETALTDDLSMPRATAALFSVVKAAEQELKRVAKEGDSLLDLKGLQAAWDAMNTMDQIFGIFYEVPYTAEEEEKAQEQNGCADAVPDEVLQLVSERTAAKEAKDWEMADSLRSRITDLGFAVKDVKGGEPIVSRL